MNKFIFIIILLVFTFLGQNIYAQNNSKADSIKQARLQKKRIDSLAKVATKLALAKTKDSLLQAKREQRYKDSISRLERKKERKDSIELEKYRKEFGEEKYNEKLEELARLKQLEERIKKQREEDSLLYAKEKYEQFKKDSAIQAKQKLVIDSIKKDSVSKAEILALLAKQKADSMKAAIKKKKEEDARLKDSIKMARQYQKDSVKAIRRASKNKKLVDTMVTGSTTDSDVIKKAPPVVQTKPVVIPDIPDKDANIDSLRKLDSIKYFYNTFEYRLKRSTELSFYACISNYSGDLGGNSGFGKTFFYDNIFRKRNNFYGVSLTFSRNEFIGLRLSYVNGKISASDHDIAFTSKSDNAYTRYNRNLDFQSTISEWALLVEFNPLKLFSQDHRWFKFDAQPYGLLGLGRYKFNPQGSYYDEIAEDYIFVDLQPLRLEGQGMKEYPDREPYKLQQWNIPFGFGIKYMFSRRTSLGLEFIGRKLFTDYLDDVSKNYINPDYFSSYLNEEDAFIAKEIHNKSDQVDPDNVYDINDVRGNPKAKDFYYSFNLKFSFRLSKLK